MESAKRMISGRWKWGAINRQGSENGEVVRRGEMIIRERWSKGRVRGGDDQIKSVVFIMGWESNMLG
jgi:hypothetical protein